MSHSPPGCGAYTSSELEGRVNDDVFYFKNNTYTIYTSRKIISFVKFDSKVTVLLQLTTQSSKLHVNIKIAKSFCNVF